ncbi:g-type lectin s-receptor-like serine/threonine-protein kinase rlk1 [Quercus suber]|uniref:G-type lectin s-receptor-like serine/threonine-protein kinase rlk1 n=1 Tax=Quercus suber TaxID=58331 RepID=A0AAW0IZJ6_QUESU
MERSNQIEEYNCVAVKYKFGKKDHTTMSRNGAVQFGSSVLMNFMLLLAIIMAISLLMQNELDLLVKNDEEAINDMKSVEKFVMTASWCIQDDPLLRPSMKNVLQSCVESGIDDIFLTILPFLAVKVIEPDGLKTTRKPMPTVSSTLDPPGTRLSPLADQTTVFSGMNPEIGCWKFEQWWNMAATE